MTAAHRNRLWLVLALVLTALKLWLSRGQGVYALGSTGGEDRLYIETAQHLVRGEWLGPGPTAGSFYPLFIAAAFWLGVPLFLAQHLFYATACALFARALRPAVTGGGARLAIYGLLLANPMTFDGPGLARVLPQHVLGPLGLMIFAGLVALYLRRAEPVGRQARWIRLLGLASGAFYLTRPEILWFTPPVLLLAGAYLFGSRQISAAAAQGAARRLGLALAIAVLPVLLVCTINQRHYGRFASTESRPPGSQNGRSVEFRPSLGETVDFVTSFSRFSARVPPSIGSPEELQLFRDITHERLSPPVGELDKVGAARYLLNLQKVEWLQRIGKTLRPLLLALFWLAQILWLACVVRAGWCRRWDYPLTVATAAWGAGVAFVFMPGMIEAPPADALMTAAFGPVYLLLHLFIAAALWAAFTAWGNRGASSPPARIPAPSAGEESAGTATSHLYG